MSLPQGMVCVHMYMWVPFKLFSSHFNPVTLPCLGVTKALKRMNNKLNLPQLQKIMMEFERESEIMDLKEETISDTMDDVLGDGDEEEVRGRVMC